MKGIQPFLTFSLSGCNPLMDLSNLLIMLRFADLTLCGSHRITGCSLSFPRLFPHILRHTIRVKISVRQISQQRPEQNPSAKTMMTSAKNQMTQ